ncbi:hypothetical protein ACYCJU_13380 [Klebsiella pneumoniae]
MVYNFEGSDKICRVVFSPEDVSSSGEFEKSSVKRSDLQEKGFSVDLKKLLDIQELMGMVSKQQANVPDKRKDIFIGVFLFEKLMGIVDDDNEDVMFEIIYDPVKDDETGEIINPAHCLILCCKKAENRPHYNEARLKLNELMSSLQHMSQFVAKCFPGAI